MRACLIPFAMLLAMPALAQAPVRTDPPADAGYPAASAAFTLPTHGVAINALFYLASGAGPHPTLLLMHGFPGNEQNLDLAQAIRRAGWNVLTLHYRGTWGSPGAFSFAHCAEDAKAAVDFLESPEAVAKYRIDPSRIVVGGHSMGGMMTARVAADDRHVIGAFLIDAWDIAGLGRANAADPAARAAYIKRDLDGDMPPLGGTSEAALLAEQEAASPTIDLIRTVPGIAPRPVLVIGAERALGSTARKAAAAIEAAGDKDVTLIVMPTDHVFSDHRIALADAVVGWLARFQR